MSAPSKSGFARHRTSLLWAASLAVVVSILVGTWFVVSDREDDPYADLSDEEILAAATEFYESRPYYEQPFPYSEVPEGLPDMRSETCGQCHGEIYQEWSISTHRRAYTDDAQFMEELAKSRGEYYEDQDADFGWMCVNCHTPLMNQLEQFVIGLEDDRIGKPIYVDNPYFDEQMQQDAIGCATCHVQDGKVHGTRGDPDGLAPHPVEKSDILTDERNCVRCHQAEEMYPDDSLGCFFTTGDEWAHSPAAEAGETCQDCHMPSTTRKLADGYDVPERDTRHHWFGGSLIPKHPDFEEEIKALRPIFGSGASLSLTEHPDDGSLAVRVHNKFAGHLFPTGDPERHVEVKINVKNSDGDVVSRASETIGSVYQWYPEIELLSDNRIEPGQSLFVDIDWPDAGEAMTVDIEAAKYRMHEADFDYHDLEGHYVRGRTFHRSTWTVLPDQSYELETIEDDWGQRQELAVPTSTPDER